MVFLGNNKYLARSDPDVTTEQPRAIFYPYPARYFFWTNLPRIISIMSPEFNKGGGRRKKEGIRSREFRQGYYNVS
jgi:hypothetical protein